MGLGLTYPRPHTYMLDCKEAIDISLTSKSTTTYDDYLKAYGEFVDNLQFIPLMGRKGSSRATFFKMFEDTMKMSDSSVNVEFVKPKYMFHDEMKNVVNDETKSLINEYQYYKKIYLYGHDNEKNQAYETLEKLTNQILILNDCRDKLIDVVSRYHEQNYLKSENVRKKNQDMGTEIADIKHAISETTDDIEKTRLINQYVNKYTYMNRIHLSTGQLDALSAAKLLPFDIIIKAPKVKSLNRVGVNSKNDKAPSNAAVPVGAKESEETVTKTIDDKLKKKLKNVVKQMSSTSREESEQVAKKEKRRLKRFLFKNLSECQSTKRNNPEFMTKDELIDVISQTPSLKAKLPSNYKTMKKNELCEGIDKLKAVDGVEN